MLFPDGMEEENKMAMRIIDELDANGLIIKELTVIDRVIMACHPGIEHLETYVVYDVEFNDDGEVFLSKPLYFEKYIDAKKEMDHRVFFNQFE